jgi:dGTPase
VADIRAFGRPVAAFSEGMAETDRTVKKFLYGRMYEHWHLNRSHSKARRVVMDLFGLLFAEPNCLPPPWRERAEAAERAARARIVADYIAGMTDRYALDEHRRLFDLYN